MNDKVKFIQGSLLDCKEMEIGEFDYVDSCGVLHHLPDTEAGFKALDSVLKPDGGMGIMVYGTLFLLEYIGYKNMFFATYWR